MCYSSSLHQRPHLMVFLPQDLPLIAIDSFRHMYLFPDFEDIRWAWGDEIINQMKESRVPRGSPTRIWGSGSAWYFYLIQPNFAMQHKSMSNCECLGLNQFFFSPIRGLSQPSLFFLPFSIFYACWSLSMWSTSGFTALFHCLQSPSCAYCHLPFSWGIPCILTWRFPCCLWIVAVGPLAAPLWCS